MQPNLGHAHHPNPVPAGGTLISDTQLTLSWIPGYSAKSHAVHFSDDLDYVKSATRATRQSNPSFTTDPLDPGKTYFWRVDEYDGQKTHSPLCQNK